MLRASLLGRADPSCAIECGQGQECPWLARGEAEGISGARARPALTRHTPLPNSSTNPLLHLASGPVRLPRQGATTFACSTFCGVVLGCDVLANGLAPGCYCGLQLATHTRGLIIPIGSYYTTRHSAWTPGSSPPLTGAYGCPVRVRPHLPGHFVSSTTSPHQD